MPKRLTPKQRNFANDYLKTGNATQAVLAHYDVKDAKVAGVMGSENLGKPSVRKYIESKSERAAEIIYYIAEHSEQDNVRLSASKDILDRAGFKPVEKTLNVNIDHEESTERTEGLAHRLNRLLGR